MTQGPYTDFCVLSIKTDNPGNPHCLKQELILVGGTLAQESLEFPRIATF